MEGNQNILEKILDEIKNLESNLKDEIKNLDENIKNLDKKIKNLESNLKDEIKNLDEKLDFQDLKYNTLKEVLLLRKSYNNMEEYRGEYVSEGLGLNSRKRKFVNNPYW